MKVMLVNGSPHKRGCIYTALSEIAKILNEEGIDTEFYHIGTKPISGCISCWQCSKLKHCVISDTVNDFIEKAMDADGFIFGAPVYFASINGAMSAFMDRAFFAGNSAGVFAFKPVAGIVNARRAGNTASFEQLNKYFTLSQMPIISSTYWNMTHGFTPDDVKQDLEGLQTMRILGRNMAWFLKCKQAGEKRGVSLPKQEKPVRTHFIR